MWIIWALLAAVFSGVCVIFQKKVASAGKVLQTAAVNVVIVVITVFLAALMRGKLPELALLSAKSWYLAAAAGLLQAASWIAYFLALRDANVSLFMVLDKTGIIFAMLMATLFLREQITLVMLLGSAAILLGTGLMAAPRSGGSRIFSRENRWMLWALLSAFLTAATNIVIKLDASPVDVTVLTLVRMSVYAQADGYFFRKPDVFNKESMLPIYVSKCSKTGSPCSPRRKSRSLQYAEKCAMGKIVETVV